MATAASEAAGSATASDAKPLSLAELPAAWLQQLPGHLKGQQPIALLARSSLFASCKVMRDLMLAQNSVRLRFQQPLLGPGGSHPAKDSLARACSLSTSVSLVLVGNPEMRALENGSLLSRAMAAAGHALTAIKSVELQGLTLDALAPSWLTSTCPNMTSLELHSCQFTNLPAATTTIPAFGQLKHLAVVNPPPSMTGRRTTPAHLRQVDMRDWKQHLRSWQHQLRALPGLQSLSLDFSQEWVFPVDCLQCFCVVGSQLTQLSLSAPPSIDDKCTAPSRQQPTEEVYLPQKASGWFPNVTHLSISWVAEDRDLQTLLGMPCVTHLQCKGFYSWHSDKLRPSPYTHRPCNWTHLILQDVSIAALAMLPLNSLRSVQIAASPGQRSVISPSYFLSSEETAPVVSRCGAISWGGVECVRLACHKRVDMAPLLPLLDGCPASRMEFCSVVVNAQWLAATMIDALADSRTLKHIKFESCTFVSEVWPLLLPSLPRSVELVHFKGCDMAVENLICMCVAARRPIAVYVGYEGRSEGASSNQWERGWEQHIQAAMAEAGHEFVEVVRGCKAPAE